MARGLAVFDDTEHRPYDVARKPSSKKQDKDGVLDRESETFVTVGVTRLTLFLLIVVG